MLKYACLKVVDNSRSPRLVLCGQNGEKLDWVDNVQSFVAAHDVLEHDAADTGAVTQELTALGTGLFLRMTGYYSSDMRFSGYRGRVGGHSNDLFIVVKQFWREYTSFKSAERERIAHIKRKYPEATDVVPAKFGWPVPQRVGVGPRFPDTLWAQILEQAIERAQDDSEYIPRYVWSWAERWIRHGFVRGEKLYGKLDEQQLENLFSRVKEQLKYVGANVRDESLIEVVVDTETADVVMTVKETPIFEHLTRGYSARKYKGSCIA